MADETRIGSVRSGGIDQIKQSLGLGTPAGRGGATAAADAGGERGGIGGPRGQRMLPADYPLDALDRNAVRGTYLDILV